MATDIRANPLQWEIMFKLLSLDVTKALREVIDLNVPDDDELVPLVRELLSAYRAIPHAERQSRPPFGETALNEANDKLGRDVALSLHEWSTRVFQYALFDKSAYGNWIALWGHRRWHGGLWDALGLPPGKVEVLERRFLAAQDSADFDSLYEEATRASLSDWDRGMLERNELGEGQGPSGVEILLGATAAIVRNQEFWRWVVQTSSADELDALHGNACKLVNTVAELHFMEDLKHPSLPAFPDSSSAWA
jgi:hypothetical protein